MVFSDHSTSRYRLDEGWLSHAIGALIACCAVCTGARRIWRFPQTNDDGEQQLLLEFANGIEAIPRQ